MTWNAKFVSAALALIAAASQAEDMQTAMPGLYEGARFEWKHVDGDMSAQEYHESSRHNFQVFGEAAHTAFEETLTSFGISRRLSRQGAELTGAAVGLAFKGGKLDLNESQTLSLSVDDVVTEDRSIYFNIKLDW